jgi:hypothetical protein
MKQTLLLLLVLSLPALLVADEKPADTPNTLTPEEVRRGWLLLFDGETTFGWKIDGEAKVEKGVLVLGGEKATMATTTTAFTSGHAILKTTWEGKTEPSLRVAGLKGNAKGPGKNRFAVLDTSSVVIGAAPRPAIAVEVPAGTRVLLRDVKFQPVVGKRLFNGKDLDGWKVFVDKDKKSKFTVTKEGWLNVKDGPGDLQTKKLFADFILQLECISNGKHLNSGIFFRCIPDKYQQGYEAQIHNGWSDKPKTYTIEEFDPQSHKSLGKKKVQSLAMDYGTGAIYRRMPARKAVAKDKEWFTMTVVARGRHIATWVNGIQVVDWTDNRPAKENAREGYRAEAGAISIQGHDPTTDLSFRNIRISELAKKK